MERVADVSVLRERDFLFFGFSFSFEPVFLFEDLFVVMPLKGQYPSCQPVPDRDDKPLLHPVDFGGPYCIIVSLCVERTKRRRLISSNSDHFAAPDGNLLVGSLRNFLNVGEKSVIVSLQTLMVSCLSSKIENELRGTDGGDCSTESKLVRLDAGIPENIGHRCRTQEDCYEVAPTIPALQRHAPAGVVDGISKDVELQVGACVGHVFLYFFGPGGGEGGLGAEGWRGPGPAPGGGFGVSAAIGWRGPNVFCSGEIGWRTPMLSPKNIFPLFKIVSLWLLHLGMAGVWSRSNAATHRTIEIQTFCTLEVKHTKYSINTFGGDQVLEVLA